MEGSSGSSWSVANPGPLGLAGFAMTTFILSMVNSNLVGATSTGGAVALAFAYGGVVQLLAGMWEFRAGNTFGAVAFSSFGAFWIAFFLIASGDAGAISSHGLGLFLWAWAIFTAYMTIAALRQSGAVLAVFVLLTVTFVLLALSHDGGGSTSLLHAGGYVGIATAIAAWYASAGAVINSTFGKEVVPLFAAKK
jgi:succinate-acetate transporter protein